MQMKNQPELSLVEAFAYSLLILLTAILGTCSCASLQAKAGEPTVAPNNQQASPNISGSNSLRAEIMNMTLSQLREANRQHPLYNVSALNPYAVLHYRHPLINPHDPAVELQKRNLIEDPSLSRYDPEYMDACNKRAKATTYDHMSPLMNHPEDRRFSTKHAISDEQEDISQMLKAMQDIKYSDPPSKRPKRSVVSYDEEKSAQAVADPRTREEKNLVYFRSPKSFSAAAAAATKRTSFVLSGAKSKFNVLSNSYKGRHFSPAKGSKNKYLYMLDSAIPATKLVQKAPTPTPDDLAASDQLIRDLRIQDLKTTWHMACLRHTISQIQSMPGSYASQVDRELALAPAASEDTKRTIDEQLHAWMPTIESLVKRPNETSLAHQNSSVALSNLSHRLQYFNLILEQMVFEQKAVQKRFVGIYCDMEKILLKLLCDVETLIPMLASLEEALWKVKEKHNMMIGHSSEHVKQFLESIGRRLKHSRGQIGSPFEQLMGGGSKKLKRIGEDLFVTRDVMPLEQRLQANSTKRMLRDQLVFKDLSSFFNLLDSILAEISA